MPLPRTVSPSVPRVTSPPIWPSSARNWSTGWALLRGQPSRVTDPPVTSAAAKNGIAPDRSGSMVQPRPDSLPGSTDQTSRTESSTPAPAARSICTVIRTCGADGIGGPTWRTTTPRSKSGAASSRPETSWLDADASSTTSPPVTRPVPRTVSGRPPVGAVSMLTPRERRASISGRNGRRRIDGSPSKVTWPCASPAIAGMNRITVPAWPTSTCAGPCSVPGRTTQRSSSTVETLTPIARRPPAIISVSRARSGRASVDGPTPMALRISARAVIDFEPGSWTVAATGSAAVGGFHGTCAVWLATYSSLTCRRAGPRSTFGTPACRDGVR